MIELQEVTFYLSADRVVFAQLVKIGFNEFAAAVSQFHPLSNLPLEKYFMWLPCPEKSDAAAAYKEVVKYCSRNSDDRLLKVNNPCNCEFLSVADQQSIVGVGVQVTVNEPI